ncbi:MAG: SpoIIE family protein phosphatase [Solirubrobacteraceae bacterium]
MARGLDGEHGASVTAPFVGDSAMTHAMGDVDWAATPLGPVEDWPSALRSTVAVLLPSQFPMFVAWGPELRLFYNDAYALVLGDKHPAALGAPFAEVWRDIWEVIGPLVAGVLRGESTFDEDLLLVMRRRGFEEETYFTFSYSPITDAGVTGLFCACSDTTSSVLGQRRLRALQQLGEVSTARSETVENACEAMMDVLARQRADVPFALVYLFAPDAACARLVAGQGVAEGSAIAPATLPAGADAIWRLGPAGAPRVVEGLHEGHAGEFLPGASPAGDLDPRAALVLPLAVAGQAEPVGLLVAGASAYHELDAEYRGFLELVAQQVAGSVTDAQAYAAERQRAEALAEIDRAKTEFFANVSHEFRTPLTLIAGPADEALSDPLEPEAGRERWQTVRRNTRRLRRLVDDMLDFARIEAGRLQPEVVPTDLAALTSDIVSSFAPAVSRAGLALNVDCPPLPAPVAVDPDMWEKVVLNLLSNALKYTPHGSIEVRQHVDDGRVALSVADTGVGVPASDLPRLFERFHRVRGAAGRSHEGAGIGLALVHELVRLQGGTVSATSTEGHGSEFTVTLPFEPSGGRPVAAPHPRGTLSAVYLEEALQWSAADEGAGEEDAAAAIGAAGATAGATVLVVDDNLDLRRFVARLLSGQWRVLQAGDGHAALAIAREQRPDLVLTDVMMPGLDGLALLRALRGDPATASIPVVLLSARAGEESAIEGLDAGADDYLPKPFSARELLARVRSNLELARLRNREAEFRSALVGALHEGVVVLEPNGTVIEVNDAFAAMTGYGPEGLPYPFPYPWSLGTDDPEAREETALAAFLDSGEGEFLVPVRHRDGHRLWIATTIKAVPDRPGHEGLSVASARDVTLQREAAEREATVAEFVAALSAAGGIGELLDTALSALGELFGARHATLVLWTADGPETVTAGGPAGAGEQDVLAALATVRRRGAPHVSVHPSPSDLNAAAALSIALDTDAGFWLELDPPRPVTDRDRVLFGLVAGHLGTALARARSFAQARDVALTLQHAILGPTRLPRGFAARYQPAVQPLEVGGDWYDIVDLGERRIGLVVGDCVGRGLTAAAVMGQLRSASQALLLSAESPGRVLAGLDAFAARLPDARCTTVLCAVLDAGTGAIRYSCAGHPPAVVTCPDGATTLLDGARGLPVGVDPAGARPEADAVVPPGGTLLLYSDGLVERRRESLDDGIDRLRRHLAEHAALAPGTVADRLTHAQQPRDGYEDDVAVLLYRRPPAPLRIDLAAEPARLAGLRRDLRAWLATCAVAQRDADAVVLGVGEAASNAIEHAVSPGPEPTVTVTVAEIAGTVDVHVRDTGRWRPPDPEPHDRGRGLAIIRAVMDAVEVEPGPHGTTIHMARRLGP